MSGSWEKAQRGLALEKGFLFTYSKMHPALSRIGEGVMCSVAHHTKHVLYVEFFYVEKNMSHVSML